MRGRQARILVVDDEPRNLRLLEGRLAAAGYNVDTATSGRECLELVDAEPPDLIILDVMMPGMDGFEVLTRLRTMPAGQTIPVILLTSLQAAEHRARGLEAGADEFLSKPVHSWELLGRVRTLLEAAGWFARPALHEGSAFSDTTAGRVLIASTCSWGRLMFTWLLEAGHSLELVPSLAVLPRAYLQFKPDLLMLCTSMDGHLELCAKLKADPATRDVPILICIEEAELALRSQLWEAEVDDYVHAPLDQAELLARSRALVRRKRAADLAALAHAEVAHRALHDGLTGLVNRGYFEDILRRACEQAARTGGQLFLLLIDVDHFKRLNDTWGHPAGDMILRVLAQVLRASTRQGDSVARIGGEEFALLLPDTTAEMAERVAERIRGAIEGHPFIAGIEGSLVSVTVSVGIAELELRGGRAGPTALLEAADRALYAAKHAGRNKVETAASAVAILPVRPEGATGTGGSGNFQTSFSLFVSSSRMPELEAELRRLVERFEAGPAGEPYLITITPASGE